MLTQQRLGMQAPPWTRGADRIGREVSARRSWRRVRGLGGSDPPLGEAQQRTDLRFFPRRPASATFWMY